MSGVCLRENNDACKVFKIPSVLEVANSKFGSTRVKEMGSDNNNKKNNLVQMGPKV